jgi:hypothetical protein
MNHILYVSYDGGLDVERDKKIREAVGGKFRGSGCCLFGEATRDLEFTFPSKKAAAAAQEKLKAANIPGPRSEFHADQ